MLVNSLSGHRGFLLIRTSHESKKIFFIGRWFHLALIWNKHSEEKFVMVDGSVVEHLTSPSDTYTVNTYGFDDSVIGRSSHNFVADTYANVWLDEFEFYEEVLQTSYVTSLVNQYQLSM